MNLWGAVMANPARNRSQLNRHAVGLVLAVGLLAAPAAPAARADGQRSGGCSAFPKTAAPVGALSITFYGVSTLLFSDGQNQLLVDGFFSRPDLLTTGFKPIGPARDLKARIETEGVRKPLAVLVAHAHHDHALDAPTIAAHTGAVLVGGASTINLGQAAAPGLPVCQVADGADLAFGPYRVQVFAAPHGDTGWLLGRLLQGDTPDTLTLPARFWRLKDRENFSYLITHGDRAVLVHPSAGYTPGQFAKVRAPLVLLGMGRVGKQSREKVAAYWREVGQAVHATTVAPIHWDAFTQPIDRPLKPTPRPFDNVPRGQALLAEAVSQGPRPVAIVNLDARDALVLAPDGAVSVKRHEAVGR